MKELAIPKLLTMPIYCVRSEGDEAYWGLKISRVLSNLPYQFWQPLFQGIMIVASIAVVIVNIIFPTWFPFLSFFSDLDFFPFFFIKSLVVYCLIGVAIQLLMLCLPFITLSQFIFGGERIFDSWFTYITVSPVLAGIGIKGSETRLDISKHRSNQIRYKTYKVSGRGLRHCLIYTDKDFLRDIDNVILSRFTANKVAND
jgi:hypothetical protein